MRILICDDDRDIATQLQKILQCFFQKNSLKIPEIVIFNNGEDLLADSETKDIVFLDVEMPGVSGILCWKQIKTGES